MSSGKVIASGKAMATVIAPAVFSHHMAVFERADHILVMSGLVSMDFKKSGVIHFFDFYSAIDALTMFIFIHTQPMAAVSALPQAKFVAELIGETLYNDGENCVRFAYLRCQSSNEQWLAGQGIGRTRMPWLIYDIRHEFQYDTVLEWVTAEFDDIMERFADVIESPLIEHFGIQQSQPKLKGSWATSNTHHEFFVYRRPKTTGRLQHNEFAVNDIVYERLDEYIPSRHLVVSYTRHSFMRNGIRTFMPKVHFWDAESPNKAGTITRQFIENCLGRDPSMPRMLDLWDDAYGCRDSSDAVGIGELTFEVFGNQVTLDRNSPRYLDRVVALFDRDRIMKMDLVDGLVKNRILMNYEAGMAMSMEALHLLADQPPPY